MGVQSGVVEFCKAMPTVEMILVQIFKNSSLKSKLSIVDVAEGREVDNMNLQLENIILNERIIYYALEHVDSQGVDFWMIETTNRKYVEYMTGISYSKLKDELVKALRDLGGVTK